MNPGFPGYFCGVKKFIVAIVALVYIALSMGVVMNYHYCRGELASVKFKIKDDDLCGCGMGKKHKHKCCNDELKVIKIDDSQKQAVANIELMQQVAEKPEYILLNTTGTGQQDFIALHYNSPPLQTFNEVYLHNCVFRL